MNSQLVEESKACLSAQHPRPSRQFFFLHKIDELLPPKVSNGLNKNSLRGEELKFRGAPAPAT